MFLFGDDDENYQEQSLAGTAPPRGKSCMLQCSAATVQQSSALATALEPRLLDAVSCYHTLCCPAVTYEAGT